MSDTEQTTPEPEPATEPDTTSPDPDTDDDDDTSEDDDEGDRELAQQLGLEPKEDEGQEEKERQLAERSDESETERTGSTEERSTESADPHQSELPAPPNSPLSYEELDTMADEGELTEATLQKTLNDYASAIRSEYEQSLKEADDLTNVEGYTRDFFKKNVHSAAAQIVWLANNAESESVKLKAATTVIHEALADSRADGDPIKNLLAELTATPATAPTP